MNRAFARILLGTVVVAAVVPFVLPLRDGRPLLDYRQIRLPGLPEIEMPAAGGDATAAAPVTFYKWRGPEGEWQFGNTPPAQGIPFEIVSVDPGANLYQGISAPAPAAATPPSAPATVAETYSPARVQQALDQARKVQSMMNQRASDQEAVLHVD